MRAVCYNCGKEMSCQKNSVEVIHFLNNRKEDGIDFVAQGDRWGCTCGAKIVIGFGEMVLGMDLSEKQIEYLLKNDYLEIKR